MNWVDIAILAIVAAAAVHGLRVGAVLQVFSYGGFWVGLALGALLASVTVRGFHTSTARTVVAFATMLGIAVALSGLARFVGSLLFRRVHRSMLGGFDSALGVIV